MNKNVHLVIILFSFLLPSNGFGAVKVSSHAHDSTYQNGRLFNCDDYLELEIVTDLDTLIADIGDNPSYHPAELSYKDIHGDWHHLNVEIRTRGKFRNQPNNCDFPPLRIKFPKEERENTIFEDHKFLKMVTHCQTALPEYEQYVLQEYLIYKSYNLLSGLSLRVQLLKIKYIDTEDPEKNFEKFAFFLENPDDMAERNNGNLLNLETVSPDAVNQDHYTMVAFFEYMIVNTDWSLPIMHNIELVSLDYFEAPYPVPYDFDWSGLINIPYEVPTISGMQKRIPERVFKGKCRKKKEYKKTIRLYHSKKQDLFDLYIDFPYLDYDIKTKTLETIQVFYEILNDKYIFRVEFIEKCRD